MMAEVLFEIVMLLVAATVVDSRPNFSGVWQLNREKSRFRGPAPRDIVVRIEHHEPRLVQAILTVAADGREQQQTFTFDIGGSESMFATPLGEGTSRARWNGSELIIDAILNTPSRVFRFRDHWTLSADRHTLQMAHRDDDLAGQMAILEKAPADLAARFGGE